MPEPPSGPGQELLDFAGDHVGFREPWCMVAPVNLKNLGPWDRIGEKTAELDRDEVVARMHDQGRGNEPRRWLTSSDLPDASVASAIPGWP